MKTKLHSGFDCPILGIALFLLTTYTIQSHAQQLRSRYNLSGIHIGLMNGKRISGTITSFTADSLALMDKHIAPPGSSVVFYSRDLKLLRGTVEAVTRENLVITQASSGRTITIPRNRITSFQVKKYSCSKDELRQFQQRWYSSSSIKYISLRKNGSGAKGGLIGMAMGAVIGAAFAGGNKQPDPPGTLHFTVVSAGAGGAIAGGLVGLCVGVPMGLVNNQMFIDGDREKFRKVKETLLKK